MTPLPELDTVSFETHLPLLAHHGLDAAAWQVRLLETALALAVLAAPAEQDTDASGLQQRLEAKLDFVLELGLQSRYPAMPPAHRCRIGLEAVIWQDLQPTQAGQTLLLQLHPSLPSASALYLPLTVQHSQPDEGGYLHHARLQAFPRDNDLQKWERWVFTQHRQRIHKPRP